MDDLLNDLLLYDLVTEEDEYDDEDAFDDEDDEDDD